MAGLKRLRSKSSDLSDATTTLRSSVGEIATKSLAGMVGHPIEEDLSSTAVISNIILAMTIVEVMRELLGAMEVEVATEEVTEITLLVAMMARDTRATRVGSMTSTTTVSSLRIDTDNLTQVMTKATETTVGMASSRVECKMATISTRNGATRTLTAIKPRVTEPFVRCPTRSIRIPISTSAATDAIILASKTTMLSNLRETATEVATKEARTTGVLLKCSPITIRVATGKSGLIRIRTTMATMATMAIRRKRTPSTIRPGKVVAELESKISPTVGAIRATIDLLIKSLMALISIQASQNFRSVVTTRTTQSKTSHQSRTWDGVEVANVWMLVITREITRTAATRLTGSKNVVEAFKSTGMHLAVQMPMLGTQETFTPRSASRPKTLRLSDFRASLALRKLQTRS